LPLAACTVYHEPPYFVKPTRVITLLAHLQSLGRMLQSLASNDAEEAKACSLVCALKISDVI